MNGRSAKNIRPRIGLLMATELEAAPLISEHGFEALEPTPFPAYIHGDVVLVISGIGKGNAAAAATWLLLEFSPKRVVNAGAAGSTGDASALGDVFQIERVLDADRTRLNADGDEAFDVALLGEGPSARLATQDHPVTSGDERESVSAMAELVDMEGATIAQVCARFGVAVHLIKFISDIHDGHSIAANIVRLRAAFCKQLLTQLASIA